MVGRTTSTGSRPRHRLAAHLVLTLLLGLALAATAGTSLATRAQAATSRTITFKPSQIPFSAAEIPNPMRGQYRWLGQAPQPAGSAAPDTYYRDQVRWGEIEPSAGSFDLSWFDAGLEDAASHGGKFGFRVMAWCPGCWTEAEGRVHTTPSWVPTQGATGIPDWNNPAFLTDWDDLMRELGTRYGDDPRLGWVDVGGYGKYGEWHTDGEGQAATPTSMRRMISAVHDNFPKQHVVINAMNSEGTRQALAVSPTIGVRMDCLGLKDFFYPFDHSAALRDRWRTAPVLTEWCHAPSTSTVTGLSQVSTYHVSTVSSGNFPVSYSSMSSRQKAGWLSATKHAGYRYQLRTMTVPRTIRSGHGFTVRTSFGNVGSAPAYDAWRVELRLFDTGNHVVAKRSLGINLRTLLPGSRGYTRTSTLSVAPGTYRIGVAVVDPTGYLAPMRLATHGRIANGTYWLGKVKVTR